LGVAVIAALFVLAATALASPTDEAAASRAVRRMNTLNSELLAMMAQYSDSLSEAEADDSDADENEVAGEEETEDADAVLLQVAESDSEEQDEEETADEDEEEEDTQDDEMEMDAEEQLESESENPALVRTRNVDPTQVNIRHAGTTFGQTDPARLGIGPGETLAIIKETPVYDSMGEVEIGVVHPQKIGGHYESGINAGEIAMINNELHVMAHRLETSNGRVTGWVPVTAFSHAPEIVAFTKTVERAIRRSRPHDNGRKTRMLHIHQMSALGPYKNLYVFPHQTGRDNLAKAFFTDRRTKTVPLLLNVPTEGGSTKWGEIADVIPLDAEFHRVRSVPSISIPLFTRGANDPVPAVQLKFVYGYTLNNGEEKRWGWINNNVLGE